MPRHNITVEMATWLSALFRIAPFKEAESSKGDSG